MNHAPSGNRSATRPRRLDREARLADAAGPGQRDQPGVVEQQDEVGEVAVAAEERGQPFGQVARRRGDGPQRREVRRQARDVELLEALGARDVAQDVAARDRAADVPSGRASATRAAVVSDSRTWPPWPAAATRAARFTSKPP